MIFIPNLPIMLWGSLVSRLLLSARVLLGGVRRVRGMRGGRKGGPTPMPGLVIDGRASKGRPGGKRERENIPT